MNERSFSVPPCTFFEEFSKVSSFFQLFPLFSFSPPPPPFPPFPPDGITHPPLSNTRRIVLYMKGLALQANPPLSWIAGNTSRSRSVPASAGNSKAKISEKKNRKKVSKEEEDKEDIKRKRGKTRYQ